MIPATDVPAIPSVLSQREQSAEFAARFKRRHDTRDELVTAVRVHLATYDNFYPQTMRERTREALREALRAYEEAMK